MTSPPLLDAVSLIGRMAARIPTELRGNVVVIGSIATAWAYRDISGTATVATKDIDLLLRPAVDAISTAETLARQLLDRDWQPIYPNGREPGTPETPDDQLPALRLSPPQDREGWFVELLGEPLPEQRKRKAWRRFETSIGVFGLPCYRFMPVATHGAALSDSGIRTALPARMALAHLLEHADPDTTPISNLPGNPPRFAKDVGRGIALWWLATGQSSTADEEWLMQWRETLDALYPGRQARKKDAARRGLACIEHHLHDAHAIAMNSVLAPHGTTVSAWLRAFATLTELIEEL